MCSVQCNIQTICIWCMVVIYLEIMNPLCIFCMIQEKSKCYNHLTNWNKYYSITFWMLIHRPQNPLMNRSNYNRGSRKASVPHLLTALVIDSYKADSITHTSDECGSSCLEKNVCGAQYITHVIPNYKINYAIWRFTIQIQTYEVRTNFLLNLVMFSILLKDMV